MFIGLFVTFYPLWVGFTLVCFWLDWWLFPEALARPLKQPIFIIGNHRTGSTFLHRLLAADTDTFASTRLWDLLLPSLIQKRAVAALGRVDGAIGAPVRRLLTWLDARWANDYRKVHPMGLWLPEEDEFLLLYSLRSAAIWECFPDVARFRRLFWSDTDMPPAELDAMMTTWHRLALRCFHNQTAPIWLSKNPLFSARVSGLRRAFPDARFVLLVRDPRRVVPSTASLIHHALRGVGAVGDGEQRMDLIEEICTRFYAEPLPHLADLPPSQLAVVRFEPLQADLVGTVEGFLTQLGVPMTEGLRASLVASQRREYRPTHRYDLADWGLSKSGVRERYDVWMQRYGYD